MSIKTRFVLSLSHDPWHNLALEEYLLKRISPNEVVLYLWQNENTVVIGRNQNAWKECDCRLLEAENGKLARRLSGGGAVFHDLGNLNFTFLMDRKLYSLERQLEVILGAVRKAGIDASFSGRNDLVADGRKFSGNAFYFDTDTCYHHGTILLNTDFSKLVKYLQVSPEKIISKGIASVRSRVVNLTELNSRLTVPEVMHNLKETFSTLYANPAQELAIGDLGDFSDFEAGRPSVDAVDPASLYGKYSSWEWRYGETPRCDVSFETRFPWGGIELLLGVDKGRITSSVIYSDALDADFIDKTANSLLGLPLRISDLAAALSKIPATTEQRQIISDVTEWLKTRSLP